MTTVTIIDARGNILRREVVAFPQRYCCVCGETKTLLAKLDGEPERRICVKCTTRITDGTLVFPS